RERAGAGRGCACGSLGELGGREEDFDPGASRLAPDPCALACRAMPEGNMALEVVGNERLNEFKADVGLADRIEIRREARPAILYRDTHVFLSVLQADL